MRIFAIVLFLLFSCEQNTMDACKLHPDGYTALMFLERIDDNSDCPSDIILYAKTTTLGGFVKNADDKRATYTHVQDECATTGIAYLDGYDLRSVQKLENIKIAYTVYMHEPPHGMAVVRVNELCNAGEYGVYVGVRP